MTDHSDAGLLSSPYQIRARTLRARDHRLAGFTQETIVVFNCKTFTLNFRLEIK